MPWKGYRIGPYYVSIEAKKDTAEYRVYFGGQDAAQIRSEKVAYSLLADHILNAIVSHQLTIEQENSRRKSS